MGREVPKHEILRRFDERLDRYKGVGFTVTRNWTESYDVFLRRCNEINVLKFNVLKVPHHGSLNGHKVDARLYSTSLFIFGIQ